MAKSFPNTGVSIIDSSSDLPSSPIEGLMVFQKDTNELKIYDGASWISVIDTDSPPGLVHVSTQTFSNVANVTLNNLFNSSYRNYRVLIDPITLSANNTGNYFYMYLTSSGTAVSTGYVYNHYGWSTSGNASPTAIGYGEYNVGAFVLGNNYYGGLTASLDFYAPAIATNTYITGTAFTNNGAIPYNSTFSGYNGNGSVQDGIKFAPSSAVNISGTVRVYGYRNS